MDVFLYSDNFLFILFFTITKEPQNIVSHLDMTTNF